MSEELKEKIVSRVVGDLQQIETELAELRADLQGDAAARDDARMLATCRAILDIDETAGEILEIGGPEVLTYHDMMDRYASVAGLR